MGRVLCQCKFQPPCTPSDNNAWRLAAIPIYTQRQRHRGREKQVPHCSQQGWPGMCGGVLVEFGTILSSVWMHVHKKSYWHVSRVFYVYVHADLSELYQTHSEMGILDAPTYTTSASAYLATYNRAS